MFDALYLSYDGARVSRESKLGKELLTWEKKPDWTPEKNPFPKMLYRARHRPDGRRSVHEILDSLFPVQGERGPMVVAGAAEQWSRGCQLTVNDEAEMIRAMEQGWRAHPKEAMEYLEARDNAVQNETAERHYKDVRMSELAQREAAIVDCSTLKMIPSIDARSATDAKDRKRAAMAKARAAKAAKKASTEPAV